MAFTVDDFHDLVRLLEAHPEWKQDLRRIVLSEELLALPGMVRDLASTQQRTEARLEELVIAQQRTEARLEELAVAQQRTEARLEELAVAQQRTEARLEELVTAQQRTEAHLEELVTAQQRTEAELQDVAVALKRTDNRLEELTTRVDNLESAQQRMEARLGRIVGELLEIRFRDRGASWASRIGLRKARVLPDAEWVEAVDDGVDSGRLTEAERDELVLTDAVVRARDTDGDIWLAVEVSATVDAHDVQRAQRRGALLAQLQGRARGAVAGRLFTAGAEAALAADPSLVQIPLPGDE
jgi:hypothetical protein